MRKQDGQLNLARVVVQQVGSRESLANSVGRPAAEKVGSFDLVTLVLAAGESIGMLDKQLAPVFRLSAADFSKAFDLNDDTRNKPMKAELPRELAEALMRVLAKVLGYRIGGTEEQTRAFANLMTAAADVIRAGQAV